MHVASVVITIQKLMGINDVNSRIYSVILVVTSLYMCI